MDHKLSGEKKYAKQALQESAQSEEDKSKYLKKTTEDCSPRLPTRSLAVAERPRDASCH